MTHPRGITLLVSLILATVVLTVALALLDISYKQVVLASSTKLSEKAFYNADAAMECALYWDQQVDAFDYTASSYLTNGVQCADNTATIRTIIPTTSVVGTTRTTVVNIPCAGSGTLGKITISKDNHNTTSIFVSGYSTCNASDPRLIERGLKVSYAGGA